MRFTIPAAFLASAGSLVFAQLSRAETLGSQTKVTISGVYQFEGDRSYTNFPDGSYRSSSALFKARYGNRDILEAMADRELIPSIRGYSIVMLRTDRGTHSFTFVATHATATPVRVPADLLTLDFGDGPRKSRYAYNSAGVITELAYETLDVATLKLEGFEGQGILVRKSSRKNVRRGDDIQTIKLDSGKASLAGHVSLAETNGVGTVAFSLSVAKVVDLDRFGANAPTGQEDLIGGGSGGVIITNGSVDGLATLSPEQLALLAQIQEGNSPGGNTLTLPATRFPAGRTLSINVSPFTLAITGDYAPSDLGVVRLGPAYTLANLDTFTAPAGVVVILAEVEGQPSFRRGNNGAWERLTSS